MASNFNDSEGKSLSQASGQCTRCHGSASGAQNLCSECERSDTQTLEEDRQATAGASNVSVPQPDQGMDGRSPLQGGELDSQERRAGPSISQPLHYWFSRHNANRRPVIPLSVYRPISQSALSLNGSVSQSPLSAYRSVSQSALSVYRSAPVQGVIRSASAHDVSGSARLSRSPVQENVYRSPSQRPSRSAFVHQIHDVSRSELVRRVSRRVLLEEFGVSLRAPVQESGASRSAVQESGASRSAVQESGDNDCDIIHGSPIKRQE